MRQSPFISTKIVLIIKTTSFVDIIENSSMIGKIVSHEIEREYFIKLIMNRQSMIFDCEIARLLVVISCHE